MKEKTASQCVLSLYQTLNHAVTHWFVVEEVAFEAVPSGMEVHAHAWVWW